MTDLTYEKRVKNEINNYKNVEKIHDLPRIFSYWSNTYLLPKIHELGIHNTMHLYNMHMSQACENADGETCRFISIGSGNCDLEAGIVEKLVASGISNFRMECLDVNPHVLERGRVLAEKKGITGNLVFTRSDIKSWQPDSEYHVVIAHQALHHFVELEILFDKIHETLHPHGYFLANDMIGRNGHMRWPEALEVIHELWKELPDKYKYHHQHRQLFTEYQNWDCSKQGFEGIRAQDVLPLLVKKFEFDLFLGFANIINPFVGRAYGPNFDPDDEWERAFIDQVHEMDQSRIEAGVVKPTQMIAAMTKTPTRPTKTYKHLTTAFCIRWPDRQ
jgi:SAM-dependent methyltransferase